MTRQILFFLVVYKEKVVTYSSVGRALCISIKSLRDRKLSRIARLLLNSITSHSLVSTSLSSVSNDSGHVLTLSLSTAKGTELLLGELASTLLLGVSDQLNNTSLVGSKANDLSDKGADKGGLLRLGSLLVGRSGSRGAGSDLVALVLANGDT